MKKESKTKVIILTCIKRNIPLIFLILFLMLAASLLSLVNPILYQIVIDNVLPSKDISFLLVLLVLMTIIPLIAVVVSSVKNYFSAKLGEIFTRNLRNECFKKALFAKQENFENISSSQILNRITRECGRIGDVYITNDLISFVSEFVLLLSVLITMFIFSIKLTLICIIAFPISAILTWFVSKKSKDIDLKLSNILERGQVLLNEIFKMIKLIKLKNGFIHENTKWQDWLNEHKKIKLKSSVTHNINRFLVGDLIINVTYGVLFFYAGILVINNELTIGALVTFISFIPKVYSSLRNVLNIKVSTSVINNAFEKIDEILDLPQEKTEGKDVKRIESAEFKNVDFRYSRNDFNIKNFNLSLKMGDKIGIVGSSGGGKSTLFDLLTLLYYPQNGEIMVNSENINELNVQSLRSRIAVVTQDVSLFNDTIKNNITYPDIRCNKDINRIIKSVSLNEFIGRLPDGLNTMVGENGDLLSEGEKQRIAIANAIAKDSDVILLDEFTSALDTATEKNILNEIMKMDDKIIMMISHRVYNIMGCNRVIVIDKGKILEEGNPHRLIEDHNSAFYKIYNNIFY